MNSAHCAPILYSPPQGLSVSIATWPEFSGRKFRRLGLTVPAMVQAHAKFYPVGQGGFYTGRIERDGHHVWSFVYDCGSSSDPSHLNSAIKDSLEGKAWGPILGGQIEFLIVSHLDADHVNGLKELLSQIKSGSKQAGVRVAFLPYLTPQLRLRTAARHYKEEDDYYRFLLSPAAWLFENGVQRVVYIVANHGGEGEGDDLPPDDPPDAPEPNQKRIDSAMFGSEPNDGIDAAINRMEVPRVLPEERDEELATLSEVTSSGYSERKAEFRTNRLSFHNAYWRF